MDRLTEKHFSFRCPMEWEDMPASENGRFCNRCHKEVLDLSSSSIDDVIALQRKHGAICGSIKVAVAAVSLATAACQPEKSTRMHGAPLAPDKMKQRQEVVLPGTLCSPEKLEKEKQR